MSRTSFSSRAWPLVLAFCVALTLASALASKAKAATPGLIQLNFSPPRALGYALGDLIVHRVEIVLEPAYRIDESKLSKPGRLNRWFELRSLDVSHRRGFSSRTYQLAITYQLFDTTPRVHGLATPPQTFIVDGPGGTYPLVITPWSFDAVPVVNPMESRNELPNSMQHARAPIAMPVLTRWRRAIALASVFALAFTAWLWLRVDFGGRRLARPFTAAARTLRTLSNTQDDYRAALRCVHRALNETHGEAVFDTQLEDFLRAHPKFNALRTELERFFARSKCAFFVPASNETPPQQALDELRALCRKARKAERG